MTTDAEVFCQHFSGEISEIAQIPNSPSSNRFRKNLYATVIDALSRSVFPRRTNHDRFTNFIRDFCSWPNSDRVSLTHLVRLLERIPDPEFSRLRSYAREALKKWNIGDDVPLSQDPPIEQILKLWPRESEHKQPLEKITARSLQHVELLYQYRNALIHECRQPGHSWHEPGGRVPFYNHIELYSEEAPSKVNSVWLLQYPVEFFHELCAEGLNRLSEYLQENDINPYDSYVFGDYWLEPLNR